MKKSDLITAILFIAILGYSFTNCSNYKVFGQTSSSSSSSSGTIVSTSSSSGITTSTSSSSSSGIIISTSSSSSGSTESSTSSSSSSGETIVSTSSSSSGSAESSTSSSSSGDIEGASSSGSLPSTTEGGPLSEEFTGIWRAEVERTVTVNGVTISKNSRIITTKLCLDNGVLKGFVQQPGILARGVITSQNVISSNQVELQLQDINGKTSSINFTLADGKLNGVFSNGISFSADKQNTLNPTRVCIDLGILPTTSSSSTTSSTSSSSTSTGGETPTISTGFNGLWQAKLSKEVQVNGVTVKQGSRTLTLRLCSNGGKLTGVIEHPGFFTRGVITSFDVISENEVNVNFTDRKGRTGSVQLVLNESELTGKFSNGVVFSAINRFSANPSRACIGLGTLPSKSSS